VESIPDSDSRDLKLIKRKKNIAWGAGTLFELFVVNQPEWTLAYCLDRSPLLQGTFLSGIPILPPETLNQEPREEIFVIITATSSNGIQSIQEELSARGFVFGQDYADLAWVLRASFQKKLESIFSHGISNDRFLLAHAFNFNSRIGLETTVLGNWLLLEALAATASLGGAIAEVGAFQGGNAYLQLVGMALGQDRRRYYVIDSFQGFRPLSPQDPSHLQEAYKPQDYFVPLIANRLRQFEQASMLIGFVPEVFDFLPRAERFSLVFYDCDLYQPALDTFAFFWERLVAGGLLVIHDSISTPTGWTGVRKALVEFFDPLAVSASDFWETTMSVIQKS